MKIQTSKYQNARYQENPENKQNTKKEVPRKPCTANKSIEKKGTNTIRKFIKNIKKEVPEITRTEKKM